MRGTKDRKDLIPPVFLFPAFGQTADFLKAVEEFSVTNPELPHKLSPAPPNDRSTSDTACVASEM
jgi:hypothetical protein